MIHLRTLTYTTTKSKLDSLESDQEYRDMAEVGAMLNAVIHVNDVAPWQLAAFSSDQKNGTPTIYLTGGLLHDSLLLSNKIINRYRDRYGAAYMLRQYYETFTDYAPPEIVMGPSHALPYGVHRKKGRLLVRVDNPNICHGLFPVAKENEPFAFAQVVPDDTFRKRGALADETLETVLEDAVEEFIYAAEDFVAATAKRLGLTEVFEPSRGLSLAS
jgi:hypothetical protein